MPLGAGSARRSSARTASRSLALLAGQGIDVTVAVGAHGTRGSLATVTIAGVPRAMREQVLPRVREALSPFVLKHEIVWSEEAGANPGATP